MNTLARAALIDATPVREHLRKLDAAGMSGYRIARATRIPQTTIHRTTVGRQKHIRSDTAAIILATTIDDIIRATTQPAHVDHAVLLKLLDGHDYPIDGNNKSGYARALHARGWTKNRIARTLRMSGTRVNTALEWRDAA